MVDVWVTNGWSPAAVSSYLQPTRRQGGPRSRPSWAISLRPVGSAADDLERLERRQAYYGNGRFWSRGLDAPAVGSKRTGHDGRRDDHVVLCRCRASEGGIVAGGDDQGVSSESRAIGFILLGMACISVNDMLVKSLSGGYPLHQVVFFVRSMIGLSGSLVFLRLEGGVPLLRTDRPALHALSAGLIVVANMTFFAALAVMPLGAATALFFVAPLFISLLAILVLAEPVGRSRMAAIVVGLAGVAVMMAPVWTGAGLGGGICYFR
jgi:drug/metabolite transporter (DMT)-like permease